MQIPTVFLKAKKDESIRRFHPWVFSGAIRLIEGNAANGDLVKVCANKGAVLGYGHFSPEATIAVRMIQFTPFWNIGEYSLYVFELPDNG